MNSDLVALVRQTITRYRLLSPGSTVLVAVSGGQDSVALLLCLHALRAELDLALHVGHVHHGIRNGEADADEEFVRMLATQLALPFRTARCGAPAVAGGSRCSLEVAARQVRHRALQDMALDCGAQYIALGHTADDRAETVLLNLLRGTGLRGLGAMRPQAGKLIRPLLAATRQMTARFCRQMGVHPRRDRMNVDPRFVRNRIRLELLPYLESRFNPGVRDALNRLAETSADDSDLLDAIAAQEFARLADTSGSDKVTLSRDALLGLHPALRRRVVRKMVEELRGSILDVPHAAVDAAIARVVEGTGHAASWPLTPGDITLHAANSITVMRKPPEPLDFCVELEVPGLVGMPHSGGEVRAQRVVITQMPRALEPSRLYVPECVIRPPVCVRSFRRGDRLRPLGLGGTKKLGDCFTDRRVPSSRRLTIPVIADTGGILWVPGVAADERVCVASVPCPCVEFTYTAEV